MHHKTIAFSFVATLLAAIAFATTQAPDKTVLPADREKEVRARLDDIKRAAETLDAEKVFSFVLENNEGVLVQNGRVFFTRQEALENTREGFKNLKKLEYQFAQQQVLLLSPGVALSIGAGSSTATLADGRVITTPFVQSVVLVLTNGDWKMLHAHRSFQPGDQR